MERPLLIDQDRIQKSYFSFNAAEAAFEKDGWVSTKDALPPEYELTIVHSFTLKQTRFAWREGKRWNSARGKWEIDETSWQRLPIDGECNEY